MRFKMLGRRHSSWGHFLSRTPVIIIWVVVVVLVLYKSTITTLPRGLRITIQPSQEALTWTTQEGANQYRTASEPNQNERTATNQLLISQTESMTSAAMREPPNSYESGESKLTSDTGPPTTTRRSPISDYVRHSEIFILTIQDEDGTAGTRRSAIVEPDLGEGLYPRRHPRFGPTKRIERNKPNVVPPHIRHLIEVLRYHRIDYTMDVMRSGVPRELLQNPTKYSVIVIDNFVKYDQLNRWARDQLDRFCRSNRIGVISYMIDDGKLGYHSSETVAPSPEQSTVANSYGRRKVTAKQYPISFEAHNLDCRNSTSTSCLLDYQLNDKAELLRIIKGRPGFVLKGELSSILKSQSLVTMTSNHATHEPLTWSWSRKPKFAPFELGKRSPSNQHSSIIHGRQRRTNHERIGSMNRLRKRAVLPSPTSATSSYADDTGVDRDQDAFVYDLQGSSEDYSLEDSQALHEKGGQSSEMDSDDVLVSNHLGDVAAQSDDPAQTAHNRRVVAMLDNGLYDDIRRVLFGVSNEHWLNRLLLLDAIEHLSSGRILTPLERYIQIDIDDIFVGASGTRMNASDVLALIEGQEKLAKLIEGNFKFNLGFSGRYFMRGSEAEQLGDKQLILNAAKFTWFCHFWSHSKAHLFNSTEALATELKKNLKFAHDNELALIGQAESGQEASRRRTDNGRQQPSPAPTYAVAPHHSGVYPIHEALYEAWSSILNVQVTSTEEYPHLRPANQRRGFVHRTIKVLPRQTCGLYTHTILRDKYPGGIGRLVSSIKGGELFETVVHNPVNIYMSHMSNYANDRLGLFTFKSLFEFVNNYTNLRLRYSSSEPPIEDGAEHANLAGPMFLADYYFRLHPEESEPLWTNPCVDKRHLAIWSSKKVKLCEFAPKLLIVGPQKTGTTALQTFLTLNPTVRSSRTSSEDFEEVQFFNDKHYFQGSDWYFERFLPDGIDRISNHSLAEPSILYLDKSATYFDDPKVPRRASSLLSDAYIVILLINPADRAYSWYQHIKAHGDPIANEFSFDDVIMFKNNTSYLMMRNSSRTSDGATGTFTEQRSPSNQEVLAMRSLRNRCLHPGYYSNHLLNWLNYYPSRQIVIIDGDWLKMNPTAVLNRLQLLLRLPKQVDYDKLLVYQHSKGFYCEKSNRASDSRSWSADAEKKTNEQRASIKCLGSGKGRKYASMSESARNYLDDHYLSHNRQLARLLYEIGQPLPRWLDRVINPLPSTVGSLAH